MSDDITVIRQSERPVVDFPGGATYRTLIGDDNGAEIPIRTGIQTSQPGYATRVHSHPYVEVLTVLDGHGEAWLDGEAGTDRDGARGDDLDPGRPGAWVPGGGRPAAGHLRHPHLQQARRQLPGRHGVLILPSRNGAARFLILCFVPAGET